MEGSGKCGVRTLPCLLPLLCSLVNIQALQAENTLNSSPECSVVRKNITQRRRPRKARTWLCHEATDQTPSKVFPRPLTMVVTDDPSSQTIPTTGRFLQCGFHPQICENLLEDALSSKTGSKAKPLPVPRKPLTSRLPKQACPCPNACLLGTHMPGSIM